MAIRKLDIIGTCEVGGVQPGGVVELDDEIINVDALIIGGHVKEHEDVEDLPLKSFKTGKKDG